ncbi:hypothetical protein [Trinickia mobilis]|uniref:hypothetical protein n=1 Tax=Trinickia mobilis TaxID=2816356 RepID=UPI001A8E538B|nr:hypothetical protein [Trinickia mobilis]
MQHVYVEPVPKGRWGPVEGYTVEFQDGTRVSQEVYRSEILAVSESKLRGYVPLLATVRVTDKAVAGHWQAAEDLLEQN